MSSRENQSPCHSPQDAKSATTDPRSALNPKPRQHSPKTLNSQNSRHKHPQIPEPRFHWPAAMTASVLERRFQCATMRFSDSRSSQAPLPLTKPTSIDSQSGHNCRRKPATQLSRRPPRKPNSASAPPPPLSSLGHHPRQHVHGPRN